MHVRFSIVWSCCAALCLGLLAPALGQDSDCPAGDYQCLDQRFGAACVAISAGGGVETCRAWLAEVLRHPDAGTPEVQSLVGSTYIALWQLSGNRELGQTYRSQAEATYRQLLNQDPSNRQVLRELASIATTPRARADILRLAVEIDPTNLEAVHDLTRALLNIGDIPSTLERIAIQERAYAEADLSSEGDRLELVFSLGLSYRVLVQQIETLDPATAPMSSTDVQERLASFVDQARDDLRWASRLMEVSLEPATDPERTAANLSFLCHHYARSTFGARDCIESTVSVADAATSHWDSTVRRRLADSVASSMMLVAADEFGLDAENADWRSRFAATLRQLMSSGVETAEVFNTYFYMDLEDPDARLTALQRGSMLFPDDRQIAQALAWEYASLGIRDLAIEHLRTAMTDSPGWDGSQTVLENRVDELMRHAPTDRERIPGLAQGAP